MNEPSEDAVQNAAPAEIAPVPDAAPSAPPEAAQPATVGQRLREARTAAGLGVADVAHSLKFSVRQVELLEADNYAALPGATIVRGFARSYAKLLKLDADALLRQLDERTPSAPADVRPPDNMGVAEDHEGQRQFSALASVAIVIVLATVLLGVWHYFGKAAKPAPQSQGEPRPPVAQPQPPAAPVAAVPPAAVPAAEPAAAVPSPAAESPVPQLKFVFDGRSWLEVTDAAKQVLHTGENPAGSQLTLSGQPPFDIVVGNAGKVRLSYGDRVIDLAPHTRAEVARFKLE